MGAVHFASQSGLLTERETEVLRLIADGLSNREIAERLVVTVDTVKWYNRQIFEKLGVSSRTQAAAVARDAGLLNSEDGSVLPSHVPKNNLPATLTSFVGRDREVADVMRLVREHRLVTLTGPAGTGKTRLAMEAALRMLPTVRDGVYFVDLARIAEPSQLGSAIAGALGIPEASGTAIMESLKKVLTHHPPLLILDNFEHILEAAPLVADLLAASPELYLLITSRAALRVYGEQEYPVPPLALPGDAVSATDLQEYAAVDLFLQRAKAVRPDFDPTPQELEAMVAICQRLDGLPLAIELAAARVKYLSVDALLGQLETRLSALEHGPVNVPDRHRTLRAAIAWSHDLLNDDEQALFARLAVFRGGRSVEAITAVCGFDFVGDALNGLESLVNKNLLVVTEGLEKESRIVMLETIHEYAEEKLDERGQTREMRRKHADYFARLVHDAEPATRGGPDQARMLKQLSVEYGNIRAAVEWSLRGGDPLPGMVLVGGLGQFWHRVGYYSEGVLWTATALDSPEFSETASEVRANVLRAAGVVAFYAHDIDGGRHATHEALALYEAMGDDHGMGLTLIDLVATYLGTPEEYSGAMALAEKGRALLERKNDLSAVADMDCMMGELARMNGELERAKDSYESSLRVAHIAGDQMREAICLQNLGVVAGNMGDGRAAERLVRDAIRLFARISDPVGAIAATPQLAGVLAARDQAERGAQIMGASDALMEAHGVRHHPADEWQVAEYRRAIQNRLGEENYRRLIDEGRAMTYEELVAFVLEEKGGDQVVLGG